MISKDDKIKLLADVLAWVNSIRAEQGLEPLTALRRGCRLRSSACPIARSLDDAGRMSIAPWRASSVWHWGVATASERKVLPVYAALLAEMFDRGDLPDLDEAAA
jgi:hypothetical protein